MGKGSRKGSSGSSNSQSEDKTADRLKELVKTRQYMRQRITRIYNLVDQQFESITAQKINTYIDVISTIQKELPVVNRQIYALSVDPDNEEEVGGSIADDEHYEDIILEILSKLRPQDGSPLTQSFGATPSIVNGNKLRLPVISLPIFSNNKDESLEKFLFNFESIISKHNLSECEKFI